MSHEQRPRRPAHLVRPTPVIHKPALTPSSSDSAVKQILLTMNEKQSFIIEDLDDHHVVIKADEEWRVRRELEAEVCQPCLSPASPYRTLFLPLIVGKEHLQSRIIQRREHGSGFRGRVHTLSRGTE